MAKEIKSQQTKTTPVQSGGTVPFIREEYENVQRIFGLQPPVVQRFLEAQGKQLADEIIRGQSYARFTLPDRIVLPEGETGTSVPIPKETREQMTGGVLDRVSRADMRTTLRQRLTELEEASNKAVASSALLIRYTTARSLVYDMLPSGRTVKYIAGEGEEIPALPIEAQAGPESAITQSSDAIVEEGATESNRGVLQVPFVPAARKFYLPQWVAFDSSGSLLVNSTNEAEAHISSMQRFLWILHAAVGLASYMVADSEYQQKRYGMLGQLVNQGRALARYETAEIIRIIKQRAAAHDLDRGLSLSMPYFDDQTLEMKTYEFVVIPNGRIMFVPAFVVRAAREEAAKIAQDTRMSASTRKYLLIQIQMLDTAFCNQ